MPRRTTAALAAGAFCLITGAAIGAPGDVSRISLLPTGGQAIGPGQGAEGAAFSPDGTRVLFTSTAPFAGVATGGVRQLYMRNLATGRTMLVSSSASGTPANGDVVDPADQRAYSASLDGRFVVFASTARNLVPADANGAARDVFRKDTVTGAITVVSRDARGAQPTGGVIGEPSISSDGSRVAFTSGSQPLVAADGNGVADIYLADLRARSLTLVSRTAAGAQSPEATGAPSISADGRSVAFEGSARASVLAPGDSDGFADVFVARPASRSITVASIPTGGTDDGPSFLPALSGDGSRVAFSSEASLVDPAGPGPHAYVRHLDAGRTERASASAITGAPAMSVDGARVAFAAIDAPRDVSVLTLATGALYRASRTPGGAAPPQPSTRPALSGTGSLAAFTYADNGVGAESPVPTDTNLLPDVFVTDVGGGTAANGPALTARATINGRRITVAGNASDSAGVTAILVGRRMARIADGGAYAVAFTAPVGTASVTVEARSGLGALSRATVEVTRASGSRGVPGAAPRPARLRTSVTRPWVRASFRLPVAASWRVELRRRVPGPSRAAAFRLVSFRSGPAVTGTRTVRLRIPPRTSAGRYQVRVLMSSARGLGTTARTIAIP
jgi:Tol biopolymer transport system component